MNKIRTIILFVVILVSAFLAYGLWTLPSSKDAAAEGFSSARVAKDIEFISKEPHSVADSAERARVREYLVERLVSIGADTIKRFKYDSLTGPQNRHVIYTFDAENILAEFAPQDPAAASYIMLVAHYDSRYSQPMPKDTVWSLGAADNGYGLGVALEVVSQAVKSHKDWKQGIKVLFTDAEEVGMMGMKAIWENDRDEFSNVGLVVNIEARGPYGPALLFETSPGNEKVLELYESSARYPFTYSLTSVVYAMMPNFTDFTVVKDSIPGLNFSTVADINHYHTDLDNFSNISQKSIQHYGEQILPLTMEYLTGEQYSDKDYLRSDKNKTNFSIPLLGLLSFSKSGYMIFNFAIFIIFLLVFALEGLRGRLKAQKVFKKSAFVFLGSVLALLLGELFAYVCAAVVGAKFNLFGVVLGVPFDNIAMILFIVLCFTACLLVYFNGRAKAVRAASGSMRASAASNAATLYAMTQLYATLSLQLILCAALLPVFGENMMFFIPLAASSVALVLWRLTSIKEWLVLAIGIVLLHAFSFLYALAMALTMGALGAVAMIALIDFMMLIPLADIYIKDKQR